MERPKSSKCIGYLPALDLVLQEREREDRLLDIIISPNKYKQEYCLDFPSLSSAGYEATTSDSASAPARTFTTSAVRPYQPIYEMGNPRPITYVANITHTYTSE